MVETKTRRPRLRDAETERRILDVALARVRAQGLHVSLDQLGFEELITTAGVARSTVYRKWPTREDFHRTVLFELLSEQVDLMTTFSPSEKFALVKAALSESPLLQTPAGRRIVVVELCRRMTGYYLAALMGSPRHQAHDTLLSIAGGDEAGLDKLREAQQVLIERISAFHDDTNAMLGVRWIDGVTSAQVASLGSVLLRGFARTTSVLPAQLVEDRPSDPFDTGSSRAWNTATLGYTAMILSLVDFDPTAALDPADD